jgi:hypothetical protein
MNEKLRVLSRISFLFFNFCLLMKKGVFGVRKVELKIQCRRHILRFTFTYFKEHDFDLNEELSGTRLGLNWPACGGVYGTHG